MKSNREIMISIAAEAGFDSFDDYHESTGNFARELQHLLEELEEDERISIDDDFYEEFSEQLEEYIKSYHDEETGVRINSDNFDTVGHSYHINTYEVIDNAKKLLNNPPLDELVEIESENYERILST